MKTKSICLLLCLATLPSLALDSVFNRRRLEIEASVDKGLSWLASRQSENGAFIGGENGETTGVVSLAGMAFLSTGDTPGRGRWGKNILSCIEYVLTSQRLDDKKNPVYGMLTRNPDHEKMYSHCIATLFLSEVSGMVEPELQKRIDKALPKALAVIIRAQNVPKDPANAGGWRYMPQSGDSDLSLTGWALMALKSSKLNGAEIPSDSIDKAVKYILGKHNADTGTFGYTDPNNNANSLTGAGLLCLELTGQHGNPATKKAGQWLLQNFQHIPESGFATYGNYYAAQGMFQLGGEHWETYAEWMYTFFQKSQLPDGHWDGGNGPQYNTALLVLAFTVPYRQLPIYQRDETVGQY